MSESVSSDGESPSNYRSSKYNRASHSSSSESSVTRSSESFASHDYNKPPSSVPTVEENINTAKTLLKQVEADLVLFVQTERPIEKHLITDIFRTIMIENEDVLIKFPTFDTVFSCYDKKYHSLSQEDKKDGIHDIILKGLVEQYTNERKKNSSLKYW